jgi:heterodisulfide reductase subunit A-like polyferredoxin
MGVFVCRFGINIGGYVTFPRSATMCGPCLMWSTWMDSLYTCSVDAQKKMMELIEKHNLNRVVVASCSPRTHEPLFQNVLRKTGSILTCSTCPISGTNVPGST